MWFLAEVHNMKTLRHILVISTLVVIVVLLPSAAAADCMGCNVDRGCYDLAQGDGISECDAPQVCDGGVCWASCPNSQRNCSVTENRSKACGYEWYNCPPATAGTDHRIASNGSIGTRFGARGVWVPPSCPIRARAHST